MRRRRRVRRIVGLVACAGALGVVLNVSGCGRYGPPKRRPPSASEELRAQRAEIARLAASKPGDPEDRRSGRTE